MRRQVSELKKTIEETKNMTVQKLIYLGKILDEDKTLGEIGVNDDGSLHGLSDSEMSQSLLTLQHMCL